MEPRRIKMRMTAHTLLNFLRSVNWYCFVIPLPHTRRTNQNRTICRGDSGWDNGFWCGPLDEVNAHIIGTGMDKKLHKLSADFPRANVLMFLC